jgi:phosphoenolpyruvate phosphomutase
MAVAKTTRFRELLRSPELSVLCEAHNGLSAKVVEEAGFDGIWASGLAISAQFGVRDNNEASWTQVLDVVEFMSDATSLPIVLDGDTGYGNFNNVQRLVKKLGQRGVAGVCIEDKLFPKTNSFIDAHRQPLANIDEFAGRIKAGKDAQADPDFCLIARMEALIAGWGLNEALQRADICHRAGADAILIHSAKPTADEVCKFKEEWGDRSPVIIIPTKYFRTPVSLYREHGFSMIIWANHLLRASLRAMQEAAADIREHGTPCQTEGRIASLDEVFRLQGADDLRRAEDLYLPADAAAPAAVILAAGRSASLGELTNDRPAAMVPVGGTPIIAHIASTYHRAGIRDLVVVRGYRKEMFDLTGVTYTDNDAYADTGELVSLQRGLEMGPFPNGVIVSYGDVLFRKYILDLLREADAEFAIAVDTEWRDSRNRNRVADYARCSLPPSRRHFNRVVTLDCVAPDMPSDQIHGESMGFLRIDPKALPAAKAVLEGIVGAPGGHGRRANMPALLNALVASGHAVRVIYTSGNWCDVDSITDLIDGAAF